MTSRGGGVPRSSSQTRDAPPIVLPGRVVVGQTFAVGNAVATVIRYLAEGVPRHLFDAIFVGLAHLGTSNVPSGAFAHVYLAETGDGERAVLKRITVPDEEKLIPVMREIQVMVGDNLGILGKLSWDMEISLWDLAFLSSEGGLVV